MASLIGTFLAFIVAFLVFRALRRIFLSKSAAAIKPPTLEPPPLALGIKTYMKGDHEQARPILEHHAASGELKAQQLLAKMYYAGHGVEKNMAMYQYWLEQAAKKGDRSAKARLKALRK